MINNFFLIGVAGYIAKRHIECISKLNNSKIVATFDPCSNVGYLDSFSYKIEYFNEFKDFNNFIKKFKGKNKHLVICSPNNTHFNYIKYGLKNNFKVICEKPICLNVNQIRYLRSLKLSEINAINSILQLRHSSKVRTIKNHIKKISIEKKKLINVDLNYFTPRGKWYLNTWKGEIKKSGGILFNIGIHLFDILIYFFGEPIRYKIKSISRTNAKGFILFNNYKVNWNLSLRLRDIKSKKFNIKATREIIIDKDRFEFSEDFENLHLISYRKILSSKNSNLLQSLLALDLVNSMQNKYVHT